MTLVPIEGAIGAQNEIAKAGPHCVIESGNAQKADPNLHPLAPGFVELLFIEGGVGRPDSANCFFGVL
jgi:hypothetical protein